MLQLDFGRPVTFNRLYVSFQSKELRANDFRFEVPADGGWRPVAEVQENYDRRRVLSLDKVSADKPLRDRLGYMTAERGLYQKMFV